MTAAGFESVISASEKDRLMGRLKLANFRIVMDEDRFRELITDVFQAHYRAISTVDELLVRPRVALMYCDRVRAELSIAGEVAAFDLPDDTILRTLLNRRKNP